MIKVVVTDMDGTLLNEKHELSEASLEAIHKLYEKDIRLIISTGRHYTGAIRTLEKHNLTCDYIVASGAEIRDPEAKILKQVPMDHFYFQEILNRIKDYPVAARFISNEFEYAVGTEEEVKESMLLEARHFFTEGSDEEIEASAEFQERLANVKCINSIEELKKENISIFKIFIFAHDESIVGEMDKSLSDIEGIASASSFVSNLELTHINAQKGVAVKEYIESLGYTMDEVMALGDSMNDYSMLSMDFGATVAMENSMEEIKKVCKYMTKSNKDEGFAYAVEMMLNNELEELRIR